MSNFSAVSQTERVSSFRSVGVDDIEPTKALGGVTEKVLTAHGGLGHVELIY